MKNITPIKFSLLIITLMITIITSLPIFSQNTNAKTKEILVNKTLSMQIKSSINPATYSYLQSGFKKAHKLNYGLILIKMNTPGGLLSTTKDILTLIGNSKIPVIIWVTPEGGSATSAGAIIASASHFLFMSDGTNIGAATPIQMSGDIKNKDLRSKAINDLVGLISGLQETRGRNHKTFSLIITEAKSFNSKDALKNKLINGIANNTTDIFQFINGKTTTIKGVPTLLKIINNQIDDFKMDLGQIILDIFANPNMAYILFILGAALLYFEFQAPGGFIAGSIGTIFLVLAAIGFQVLPLNIGALALIILSFILFILEAYITSYGIISLAGITSLIFGSLFLFRTDNSYLQMNLSIVISTISAIGIFLIFIAYYWANDSRNKKSTILFTLKNKKGIIINGPEELSNKSYNYTIKISGEIWTATSSKKYQKGDVVTIFDEDKDNMILKI